MEMNKRDKALEMEQWLKEASAWLPEGIEIKTRVWHSADERDYYVECELSSLEFSLVRSSSIEAKEGITKDECAKQLFAWAKVYLSRALDERLSEFIKEEHAVYKDMVQVSMIDGIRGAVIHVGKFDPSKEKLAHYERTLESNCLKKYVLKHYCSVAEQEKSFRDMEWLHEFRKRLILVRDQLRYETLDIMEKTYEF